MTGNECSPSQTSSDQSTDCSVACGQSSRIWTVKTERSCSRTCVSTQAGAGAGASGEVLQADGHR